MSDNNATTPTGFFTVTPYLIVNDAEAAIDFYKAAFGAVETFRLNMPEGRVGHAEIRIGDSPIMMGESSEDWEFIQSTTDLGGAAVHLYLYLPDADSVFEQALKQGADVVMPMEDHSDGDRRGGVRDPFGYLWWIATPSDPNARERLMERRDISA